MCVCVCVCIYTQMCVEGREFVREYAMKHTSRDRAQRDSLTHTIYDMHMCVCVDPYREHEKERSANQRAQSNR